MDPQLHKAQIQILHALRHTTHARYSELMHPTGLDSDVFKFHIRKLLSANLISKSEDGSYSLTAKGKEYSNNLDEQRRTPLKQPKLSLRIFVSRKNEEGITEYLFQKRQRSPFWGYWDIIGGPVFWGESVLSAAQRELAKQTELQAQLEVKSFYRIRDFAENGSEILEDKLFALLTANSFAGELQNTWPGGHNQWMTLSEFAASENHFTSIPKMLENLHDNVLFTEQDLTYKSKEY